MIGNDLFDIVKSIVGPLFDREEKQLMDRELALLPKHAMLGGSKDGFKHLGVIYSHLARGAARQRGTYDRLHTSLAPEMQLILDERKAMETDRDWIKQALSMVLRDTASPQDVRDALPNCLQELVPQCRGLDRFREEAYTLLDNPRAYSQYMLLKPKIEFYVAARLLY